MTLAIFYIFLILPLLILLYRERKKLSIMTGMMASMAISMMLGLTLGYFLATFQHVSFFHASILAMIGSGLIGVAAGFPFNLHAILDGLLAGLMGGLMGAMLGVMLTEPFILPMLQILCVWSVGVFFFIFLLITPQIRHWFYQPAGYFLCCSLFLIYLYAYELENPHIEQPLHEHFGQSNHSSTLKDNI
ncbi:hypothetical protein [Halalkalibacterium ligniniphilum]|uniref:hypothetical protein n=1 Tax=Halalkalibacterium ligniniphilum TaxID=1134413 RepID=UPI000344A52E|nr:hypothetical protein [Halalkalibacterium ligniniphilum]